MKCKEFDQDVFINVFSKIIQLYCFLFYYISSLYSQTLEFTHNMRQIILRYFTFIQLFSGVRHDVIAPTWGRRKGWLPYLAAASGDAAASRRDSPSMVCLSRMWLRGFAFAAHFTRKKCVCSTVRYHSTKTAPQIPGMEYQVRLRRPFSLPLSRCLSPIWG